MARLLNTKVFLFCNSSNLILILIKTETDEAKLTSENMKTSR